MKAQDRVFQTLGELLGPVDMCADSTSRSLDMDSIDEIELVIMLEDEFDIEIPDEAAEKWRTVADIVRYIEKQHPNPVRSEVMDIDNLVAWKTEDGQIIMSVNDTKRGKAILKSATPPMPLQQSRRKFSDAIRDADGWLEQARKDVKKRDYKGAREMVLCACFALDNAMQYETEPQE